MQVDFDEETGTIHLSFHDGVVARSEQVHPHVTLRLDECDEVVGITITHALRRSHSSSTAERSNQSDEEIEASRQKLVALAREAREAYVAGLGREPTEDDFEREMEERRGVVRSR